VTLNLIHSLTFIQFIKFTLAAQYSMRCFAHFYSSIVRVYFRNAFSPHWSQVRGVVANISQQRASTLAMPQLCLLGDRNNETAYLYLVNMSLLC
jgi:hypothetical protein